MSGTQQLMSAIKSKNTGKLLKLLEEIDLDEVNGKQNGETALHLACREKFNEAVDLLVAKNGIDVNVKNRLGMTPLHEAIGYNNTHAVSKILSNPQVNVNVKKNVGRTPLHIACLNNRHKIVSDLLASPGVHVNVQDTHGLTSLHIACELNRHKLVSELLASPGVDVNLQDTYGQTPLHLACSDNYHQIVSELLASPGVDVNVRDRDGDTPIMLSARRFHENALELLLKDPRVDLDAKDEDGGLEALVERSGRYCQRKEKYLEMINNERRRRETIKLEQEQPSQDGNIGHHFETVEKLDKEMGDLEKKWKENLDIRKQKMMDLNEKQSVEKKMVAKKQKEDEAALKRKHEEEETTLNKRQKDEKTMLETTLAREDVVEQCQMAVLRELRDELAQDIQKLTNDPAQDTSGDRVKVEAAEKSLECPICMDLMRPPTRIWMCRLSHIICEPCKDGLDKKEENRGKCPTCMTEQVSLRALMAENFAHTIFNE